MPLTTDDNPVQMNSTSFMSFQARTRMMSDAAWFGLLSCDRLGYAGLNAVPSRSIACMMMASRRASAICALRIVERLAMASAQSFSLSGRL